MTQHESAKDPRELGCVFDPRNLAEHLEGHIERRASGRIRDLHVVCSDNLIILQGRSRTYHAKQLAQQVVLDMMDGLPELANHIVVC